MLQYLKKDKREVIKKKNVVRFLKDDSGRDFPGGLVAKTPCSQCRGLGLIPAQGTRSHLLQLKILQATTKIEEHSWHN